MRSGNRIELDGRSIADLEDLIADAAVTPAVRERARILQMAAAGINDQGIAAELGISEKTAGRWRKRYLEKGLPGLTVSAPAKRKKSITEGTVRTILDRTRHERPPQGVSWTSRAMGAISGISEASVRRIWREHGIRPTPASDGPLAAPMGEASHGWYPCGMYLYGRERVLVLAPTGPERRLEGTRERADPGRMNVFLRLLLGKTDRLWVGGPAVGLGKFLEQTIRGRWEAEILIVAVGTEGSPHEGVNAFVKGRPDIGVRELPTHVEWMHALEWAFSQLEADSRGAWAEAILMDFVRGIRAYLQEPEEPAVPFHWAWQSEPRGSALAQLAGQNGQWL